MAFRQQPELENCTQCVMFFNLFTFKTLIHKNAKLSAFLTGLHITLIHLSCDKTRIRISLLKKFVTVQFANSFRSIHFYKEQFEFMSK